MSNSVILLGVLGYIGAMFKNNISQFINYIMRRSSSYIHIDDEVVDMYNNAVEYVKNLNNKVINNSVHVKGRWDPKSDRMKVNKLIAPSSYVIKFDKLTWCIITMTREKLQDRHVSKLDFKIIGLNHKIYKDEIIEKISVLNDNELSISFSGGYGRIFLTSKKSFDDLFIENKSKIINSIDNWIMMEDYYNSHNIIYKLGILLSGKPGTGKTSFIVALANYLNYNIRIFTHEDLLHNNLLNTISLLRTRTICVFEDIDCLLEGSMNRTEDKESHNKSLNGLLQILDGIYSPSKVIFVLTTNHKEKLDPAIYRPGRISLDIQMGDISKKLAIEMVKHYGFDLNILEGESFPINPSYLQNKIICNLNANNKLRKIG